MPTTDAVGDADAIVCVELFALHTAKNQKRATESGGSESFERRTFRYTYYRRLEVPAESSKQSIYSWKQNDVKKFYAQHELKGIGIV